VESSMAVQKLKPRIELIKARYGGRLPLLG
jgi:hypothetical protein